MVVVIIPEVAPKVEELMIGVLDDTPLMLEVSVLTADERLLELIKVAVVVATFPFTVEVKTKELVEVEILSVEKVEEATKLVRSVDVATPLIFVVKVAPEVERALLVITEVVAVMPLMVEVRMLPVVFWVKELIILATVEATPLTIVWKRLREEEATLLVMIVVVPVEPPMLEVRVLVATVRVLDVRIVGAVRLVTVAFVVVEFPTIKLVMVAVTALRRVAKSEVEVALVVMTSVNVLTPANDWEVVEIRPREVKEAVGMLSVCIVPVDEKVTSLPPVPTAKN